MEKDVIKQLLTEMDLKSRFKIDNEFAFINLLIELGFRENKMWSEDEDPMLEKLCLLAQKLAETQLESFREWEKDGRPI